MSLTQQRELVCVGLKCSGCRASEHSPEPRNSAGATESSPSVTRRASLESDAESASAVHEARKEIGAAFQDAMEIFKNGKLTASTLLPRAITFLQGRLETVRQALNHFMEGYSEGLKEVRDHCHTMCCSIPMAYNAVSLCQQPKEVQAVYSYPCSLFHDVLLTFISTTTLP